MRVESEIREGICILRLRGRFVTGSDADFAAARKTLRTSGASRAIIDLSEVPYMDSTGLAFVVELHKFMAQSGGQLLLAGPNQRVREVLDMTRIGEVVLVFEAVEDAEAALRGAVAC